jgi:hypothetical protein
MNRSPILATIGTVALLIAGTAAADLLALPLDGLVVVEAHATGGMLVPPCDAAGVCGSWRLSAVETPPSPLSSSSCLEGAANVVQPDLAQGKDFSAARPTPGTVFDFRGTKLTAPNSSHVIELAFVSGSVCVTHAHIVGSMARDLTYYRVKQKPSADGLGFDFGGIAFPNIHGGIFIVENSWVENVEDAIYFPRTDAGPYDSTLIVRRSRLLYIRDDAIENDGRYKLVRVEDVLLDEGHMGFSSRPGGGAPFPTDRPVTWEVTGSLLHFSCKPDNRHPRGPEPGNNNSSCPVAHGIPQSTGGIFKRGGPLTVHWKNVIARVDATGAHPTGNQLDFLPENGSTFENVVVVWTGPGAFPGYVEVPGVTVTKDISVWNNARASWLTAHGCTADDCAFLHY